MSENTAATMSMPEIVPDINDDVAAEKAIKRIKRLQAEMNEWDTYYDQQKAKVHSHNESEISYWQEQLYRYFLTVPHHNTKTQQSYSLPSAKLVLKKQECKYDYDSAKLLQWLDDNNYSDCVKVTRTPAWGEVKKRVEVVDGKNGLIVCDRETGEIVKCLNVTRQQDKFSLSFPKEDE